MSTYDENFSPLGEVVAPELQKKEVEGSGVSLQINPVAKSPFWKRRTWIIALAIILGIAIIGGAVAGGLCGSGHCKSSSSAIPLYTYVTGVVLDSNTSNAIPDILITGYGSQVASSSLNGTFEIYATITNNIVTINLTDMLGVYAPNMAAVQFDPTVSAYFITSYLTPITSYKIDSNDFTVYVGNGYGNISALTVQGMEGYTLVVAVIPTNGGPGILKSELPGPITNSSTLQSSGMYYVAIQDSHGDEVPFNQANNGGISFALGMSNLNTTIVADSVAWYQANPVTGLWANALSTGTAMRSLTQLSQADALAQAQGYWNSDRAIRTACIVGTLVHSNNEGVCPGAHVTALGPDGIYSSGTSSTSGSFCVEGGANAASRLSISSKSYETYIMPPYPGNCDNRVCKNIGSIFASPSACPKPPSPPSGSSLPPPLTASPPSSGICDTSQLLSCTENYVSQVDSCSDSYDSYAACICSVARDFLNNCWVLVESCCLSDKSCLDEYVAYYNQVSSDVVSSCSD